jgi:hypothetical protein
VKCARRSGNKKEKCITLPLHKQLVHSSSIDGARVVILEKRGKEWRFFSQALLIEKRVNKKLYFQSKMEKRIKSKNSKY